MNKKSDSIEFGLLENALDSINQAINQIAWGAFENLDEAQQLKNSIRDISHGVELLLKERLKRVHPSLIWENVDRFPSLDAKTVGLEQAIHRLEKIGNIEIAELDKSLLRSLRKTRNAIEHFSWATTRGEADAIVGAALCFALSFAKDYLDEDLFGYHHRKDDTWQQLIEKSHSFTKAHSKRFETTAADKKIYYECCDFCHALAVSPEGGACEVCGHWHIQKDEDDFNVPF